MSMRKLPTAVLWALGIWLALRFLMPVLMPFLLAGALALAAEPLVSFFQKKAGLP